MNCICILFVMLFSISAAKKYKDDSKPNWAKKDIRDYTDADLEQLLDQWEEDEEPLEPDELPEYLRPMPKVDFSKINSDNADEIIKLSKKGQTILSFVAIDGEPTREEAETITKLWQTSLWNNHIQTERYMVADNRAIFMFKDGSQAWEAKDFLIQQKRCADVTIENKKYPGVFSKGKQKEDL